MNETQMTSSTKTFTISTEAKIKAELRMILFMSSNILKEREIEKEGEL